MYFNRLLKSTIVLSILICTSFGLVSCSGITRAEFDRVSQDLNNSQSNAQKVSNELAVSQSKLEDIKRLAGRGAWIMMQRSFREKSCFREKLFLCSVSLEKSYF